MELVVVLPPADGFRCQQCFLSKATGRATFAEYKDHHGLVKHCKLHHALRSTVFECGFCGRREMALRALRAHQRTCLVTAGARRTPGNRQVAGSNFCSTAGSPQLPPSSEPAAQCSVGQNSQSSVGQDARLGTLPCAEQSAGGMPQGEAVEQPLAPLGPGAGSPTGDGGLPLPPAAGFDALDSSRAACGAGSAKYRPPALEGASGGGLVANADAARRKSVGFATPGADAPRVLTPGRSQIPRPVRPAASATPVPGSLPGGGSSLPTPADGRGARDSRGRGGAAASAPRPAAGSVPVGSSSLRPTGAGRRPGGGSAVSAGGLPPAGAAASVGVVRWPRRPVEPARRLGATPVSRPAATGPPGGSGAVPGAARAACAAAARAPPSAGSAMSVSGPRARSFASPPQGGSALRSQGTQTESAPLAVIPSPHEGVAAPSVGGRPPLEVSRSGWTLVRSRTYGRKKIPPVGRNVRDTYSSRRPPVGPVTNNTSNVTESSRPSSNSTPRRRQRRRQRRQRGRLDFDRVPMEGTGPRTAATSRPTTRGANPGLDTAGQREATVVENTSAANTTPASSNMEGAAAANTNPASSKRRRRQRGRRRRRNSNSPAPQNARPAPNPRLPSVPSPQGANQAAPPPPSHDGRRPTERQRRWLTALTNARDQPWETFTTLVGDYVTEIASTKPQTRQQPARGQREERPAAAQPDQGQAGAAANPQPPAPARGRRGRGGRRANQRARAAERQYDADAASEIQRLYRADRRKAMQRVLGDTSPRCEIDSKVLAEHFKKIHAKTDFSFSDAPAAVPDFAATTPPEVVEEILRPFTSEEVQKRLQKASNTAPGADGVAYSDLRREDPGCLVLTEIFSRCWKEGRTPAQWKVSTTVLIHKKGDVSDVSNWRPLALSTTASKLFAALVADRMTIWAERLSLLSPEQKGFRSFEGCFEHNFVVQTAIDDARRRNSEACFAWLDLANAFGSVPHAHLLGVLGRMGLPERMHQLIADMYNGCSTRIRTRDGLTEEIQVEAGVKQGCPLSPIVFDLALEPVLRSAATLKNECGVVVGDASISALAYADDIVLLARDQTSMQKLLDVVGEAATWAGLRFKPAKCATLHVRRRGTMESQFTLQGGQPAVLHEGEAYLHLGIPTGFRVPQTPAEVIAGMRRDLRLINESLLAPWQKIDAVRVFLLTRLDFVMRGGVVGKRPLTAFDKEVKAAVKSWLFLPQRASVEQLYLALGEGGCGLTPLAEAVDIATIVHGFRMLHCKDAAISNIAWATLTTAVRRRLGREPSRSDVATYLSGSVEGEFARDGGDIQSLWTRVRNATRRLASRGVSWRFSEPLSELQVEVRRDPATDGNAADGANAGEGQHVDDGVGPQHREDGAGPHHDDDGVGHVTTDATRTRVGGEAKHLLMQVLRECVRTRLRRLLLSKPDQGKVFECTRDSTASNHFMAGGKYTRFADWRFIHRARLGVVPLNGCRRSDGRRNISQACRRCGYQKETLPHVINSCMVHSAALQLRHNAVLNRLATAVAGRPRRRNTAAPEVRINQTVTGDNSGLRPDLVVTNEEEKSVTIVDVTIPFENRRIALDNARRLKQIKYADVARGLAARGYSVTVDALVVGSLGAWDRQNDAVLRHLGIASRYCQLMRRLMVSDTIKWSRDIYIEHITGYRQYVAP